MLAVLMAMLWAATVVFALIVTLNTWIGSVSEPHIRVWSALLLGSVLSFPPILLAWRMREMRRSAMRVAQVLHTPEAIEREVNSRTIELAAERDEAERASQAKSELLANMSHEIRTPMTAILGYADLLLDPSADAEMFTSHVTTIRRNGEHLLRIINDILDMSKVDAGKLAIEDREVALDELLADLADLMRGRASANGIEFGVVCESRIPRRITSDPVRLRQILVNLGGNAIKFTEDGSVTLRLRAEIGSPVVTFAVSDTGCGMDEETVSRLFGAFTQADASTTRRFGGTGLGLHISKKLAALLGGDISVESQLGVGSTFTLTISCDPCDWTDVMAPGEVDCSSSRHTREQSSRREVEIRDSPLRGLRICLVEDSLDSQRLFAHHLKGAGASVVAFDSGRAALEAVTVDGTVEGAILHPLAFDLVLTDIEMPEMDGYTLTRMLRAKGWDLPIVALTANAMSGDAQRCIDAGCDAHATKPIDRAALISVCQSSADLARQRRASA